MAVPLGTLDTIPVSLGYNMTWHMLFLFLLYSSWTTFSTNLIVFFWSLSIWKTHLCSSFNFLAMFWNVALVCQYNVFPYCNIYFVNFLWQQMWWHSLQPNTSALAFSDWMSSLSAFENYNLVFYVVFWVITSFLAEWPFSQYHFTAANNTLTALLSIFTSFFVFLFWCW